MSELFISWQIELIQQVRLVHALAESDHSICVRESEIEKFVELARLGLRLSPPGPEAIDITASLSWSHETPSTRIGELVRPLIFPHAVVEHCRQSWAPKRAHRVGFRGLITPPRAERMQQWSTENCGAGAPRLPDPTSIAYRAINKAKRTLGLSTDFQRQFGPLNITSSNRGREFPIKAWDQQYYDYLGQSEFTLCPPGVCVWSYRFFEAALCGSIPIIEEPCAAYDGFAYAHFDDPLDSLRWSEDQAHHNFEQANGALTVALEALQSGLDAL